MKKWLAALPVYNEAASVDEILSEVSKYADEILVVNDGSTDDTEQRLAVWQSRSEDSRLEFDARIHVVHHKTNLGYGAALKSAFDYSLAGGYEFLVTLDCDGQHQPKRIPRFIATCQSSEADIVSGSRYLKHYEGDSVPPTQRMFINKQITRQLNELLDLRLTDAFCGFKAYRVEALRKLNIQDNGYAMPLELWVQAALQGMSVIEVPVPLIYLDLTRSFGGALDESTTRLQHYNDVIAASVEAMIDRGFALPSNSSAHRCRQQGCL